MEIEPSTGFCPRQDNWRLLYRYFLRLLSICYAVGFFLHAADFFDRRLVFSAMPIVWKTWIVYLAGFDLLAAVGLWLNRTWGIGIFFMISVSQMIAYLGFKSIFGKQTILVVFHTFSILSFIAVRTFSGGGCHQRSVLRIRAK